MAVRSMHPGSLYYFCYPAAKSLNEPTQISLKVGIPLLVQSLQISVSV